VSAATSHPSLHSAPDTGSRDTIALALTARELLLAGAIADRVAALLTVEHARAAPSTSAPRCVATLTTPLIAYVIGRSGSLQPRRTERAA
jgi:hypothetical protein